MECKLISHVNLVVDADETGGQEEFTGKDQYRLEEKIDLFEDTS